MTAARDLTGQRFGALVAVSLVPGKGRPWRVRCDCGREDVFRQERLVDRPHGRCKPARRCRACNRRTCITCGASFPVRAGGAMTCSPACSKAYGLILNRRWYYDNAAHVAARTKARFAALSDAEFAEWRIQRLVQQRAQQFQQRERLRADPEMYRAYLDRAAEHRARRALDRMLIESTALGDRNDEH